jgi:pimeloyl-ACP methyl ester carboxylesterase
MVLAGAVGIGSGLVPGPTAAAATGSISVTSSSVQVRSIANPTQWVEPATVYEGSTAQLVLGVHNASGPTRATITVVLSGLNRTVASVSRDVGSGAQTLAIPLDLSLGAWSAAGTANPSPQLSVTLDYVVPDSPGASPTPSPTPTPTPSPTPTPESSPTSAPSVPSASPPATQLALVLPDGELSDEAKVSLWTSLVAAPQGARVTVTLRGAVPGRNATASDRAAAQARVRSVQRFVQRVAAANGIDVRVVVLPPLRASRRSAGSQVVTRVTWKQPQEGSQTARAVSDRGRPTGSSSVSRAPRLLPATGTQQTAVDVPITLAPRPTVLIHGLWSSASTWSSYAAFQSARHPLWVARAVNTMNTGALLAPFGSVKTVTENADEVWTYLQGVRTELNAGEVDLVGHSMGGIIARRLLYGDHATDARAQIRSLVMFGTPNGGSNCAEIWSVAATAPLIPSTMTVFNLAYPGYPGVASTLVYSTQSNSTCFSPSPGDSVVPDWSAQALPVNQLIHATESDCPLAPSPPSCAISHTDMTSSEDWFRKYVVANLALAAQPDTSTMSQTAPPPIDSDDVIASGSIAASNPATSVTQSQAVELTAAQKLVVSVASDESNFTISYPDPAGVGTPPTITTTLTKVGGQPVYQATITGPLGDPAATPSTVLVTLSGTTTKGMGWTFTRMAN